MKFICKLFGHKKVVGRYLSFSNDENSIYYWFTYRATCLNCGSDCAHRASAPINVDTVVYLK